MKRWLCLMIALGGLARPARAYVDVAPTLGRMINDSTNIVLLQVDKVSREKRRIVFTKVADLKGQNAPGEMKQQITGGFHPREPRLIMDWAEPGQRAIGFFNGNVCQVCIGTYWYECSASTPPWWVMTSGQAQHCFAYSGSVAKLGQDVTAIVAGKEVMVPAVKYGAADDYWKACKKMVAYGNVPRGKDYPIYRFKASLQMPASIYDVARDPDWVILPGAGGREDVPGLVALLKGPQRQARIEALDELGLIGPEAKEAVPAVVPLVKDAAVKVRIHAAETLARIDPGNAAAIPVLVEVLKDRRPEIRRAAAAALGNIGRDAAPAVAALSAALKDGDAEVRWTVAETLGRIGPQADAAVGALIEASRDPEAAVRNAALDALGWIGRKARAAVPVLVKAVQGSDEVLSWTAALALVRVDRRAAMAAMPLFVRALASPESRPRWHALICLMSMDRPAQAAVPVPLLIESLTDPDTGVRGLSAWTVGEIGPKAQSAAAALTTTLRDRDGWVRNMAAPALVKILGPKATAAIPDLVAGLKDEDVDSRQDCAAALKTLGPVARQTAPALVTALQDEAVTVRVLAAQALWSINRDAGLVVPVLLEALKTGDTEVRIQALHILGEIGPEARSAVPVLLPFLKDENQEVHDASVETLEKLDPQAAARALERSEEASPARRWAIGVLLALLLGCPLLSSRWLVKRRSNGP